MTQLYTTINNGTEEVTIEDGLSYFAVERGSSEMVIVKIKIEEIPPEKEGGEYDYNFKYSVLMSMYKPNNANIPIDMGKQDDDGVIRRDVSNLSWIDDNQTVIPEVSYQVKEAPSGE